MDQETKDKHSKRIQQKKNYVKKQLQLAKNYGYHKLNSVMHKWSYLLQPHRAHKVHIFNCGDPNCSMCGNPRKFFEEETIQEKSHKQKKLYQE